MINFSSGYCLFCFGTVLNRKIDTVFTLVLAIFCQVMLFSEKMKRKKL